MPGDSQSEQLQRQHFDDIASKYSAHYGDKWSQKYRTRFINEPLLENINLTGTKVVDALCGNGETTGYLISKGAHVTGVDISQEEIDNFKKRFSGSIGICSSILSTGLESNYYDCVVIVGGLHHIHPNVIGGISEMHRILKVGGYFCFMEPHKGSIPDKFRKLWYRSDHMFAENEAGIDLTAAKIEFSKKFKFIKEEYKGNIAHLFVLNSMIFRIPLRVKPIYSPPIIWLESLIEKLQGKFTSCYVVCQWMKTR